MGKRNIDKIECVSFAELFTDYSEEECGDAPNIPKVITEEIKKIVKSLISIDTSEYNFIEMTNFQNNMEKELWAVFKEGKTYEIGRIKSYISRENKKEFRVVS